MNPNITKLQSYPFQQLRSLLYGVSPASINHIDLSLGEPKHIPSQFIKDALINAVDKIDTYPEIAGNEALRKTCSLWIRKRYGIDLNPSNEIIAVNGSREALFSFVQTAINTQRTKKPIVICPNPYYAIYPSAILLAGAVPYFINSLAQNNFKPNWQSIPKNIWKKTQLVIICNPSNPTGAVLLEDEWKEIFNLMERFGFSIGVDECYSEIYQGLRPIGVLEAAKKLGRDYRNIVMFTSLSKRSNVPGLRSGFVAGDAKIIDMFKKYRTFHGCSMSTPNQIASIAAWQDEEHVISNREAYIRKFNSIVPILANTIDVKLPDAGFYLWLKVPGGEDEKFTYQLYAKQNITVLPGSFISCNAHGVNPGRGYIRIALVANQKECIVAALRIAEFIKQS